MGRIDELYVAMYTNGNLAEHVNEKGYDVVTKDSERISVKTTTRMSGQGHVSFNPNTLQFVDRVIILRFNAEEMELEILFDKAIEEAELLMTPHNDGKLKIAMSKIHKQATFQNYVINELESGTIEVFKDGVKQVVVKSVFRQIAGLFSIFTFNSKGNPYNTRQLGTYIILELIQPQTKQGA